MSDNPHKRATSHAKTLDLNGEKTALERARALKAEFDRAKAAQDHPREQERTRQPEPVTRPTSHAKTVEVNEKKTALDRALSLKEQFGRADAAQEQSKEQGKARQAHVPGGPSHAPRAEPHLRPEGEIRRAVDREIDKEKLARENERARQASEAYKTRLNQMKPNRDKDMDRDI